MKNQFLYILLILTLSLFAISAGIAAPILSRSFYKLHVASLQLPKTTGWTEEEILDAYDDVMGVRYRCIKMVRVRKSTLYGRARIVSARSLDICLHRHFVGHSSVDLCEMPACPLRQAWAVLLGWSRLTDSFCCHRRPWRNRF